MDGNLFCHDTGSIHGRLIFFLFLVCFSTYFKTKTSTCIMYNKKVLSKSLKVNVYICIAPKSTFQWFTHKDAPCKTEAFFLENEAQTDQIKSVCQKLAWSCKRWKSAQKLIYICPFLHKGLKLEWHGSFLLDILITYNK